MIKAKTKSQDQEDSQVRFLGILDEEFHTLLVGGQVGGVAVGLLIVALGEMRELINKKIIIIK